MKEIEKKTTCKQLTVRIPPDVHRALKVRAAEKNRTITDLVEELLKEYLVREKQS